MKKEFNIKKSVDTMRPQIPIGYNIIGTSVLNYIMIISNDSSSKYGIEIKIQCLDKPDTYIISVDEIKNNSSAILHNIIKRYKNKYLSVISMIPPQKDIYLDDDTYDKIIKLCDDIKIYTTRHMFLKYRNNISGALYEKHKSVQNSLVPWFEINNIDIYNIMSNDRFRAIYNNIDKYALDVDDIKYLLTEFYKTELDFINSTDFAYRGW